MLLLLKKSLKYRQDLSGRLPGFLVDFFMGFHEVQLLGATKQELCLLESPPGSLSRTTLLHSATWRPEHESPRITASHATTKNFSYNCALKVKINCDISIYCGRKLMEKN